MSDPRRPKQPFYSQIDVSQAGFVPTPGGAGSGAELAYLLRQMITAQERQNELLQELITQVSSNELGQWRQANPKLAKQCRAAAEALGKVQTEYLRSLTAEIGENHEAYLDGEFMLNEFVDRFGPRLAHLNGLLQVLSQLSATPAPASTPNTP